MHKTQKLSDPVISITFVDLDSPVVNAWEILIGENLIVSQLVNIYYAA
jgi:hypothetical protein